MNKWYTHKWISSKASFIPDFRYFARVENNWHQVRTWKFSWVTVWPKNTHGICLQFSLAMICFSQFDHFCWVYVISIPIFVRHASLVCIHIDGLVQNCSNSSANALELLQFCTKPSIWLSQWTDPQSWGWTLLISNHNSLYNRVWNMCIILGKLVLLNFLMPTITKIHHTHVCLANKPTLPCWPLIIYYEMINVWDTVPAFIFLPRMFLSTDTDLLYIRFALAADSSCSVWCHGLTICLLYCDPLLGLWF